MKSTTLWLGLTYLITRAVAYIDIPLTINRQGDQVSYGIPMKVHNLTYNLAITLEDSEEYIRSPEEI